MQLAPKDVALIDSIPLEVEMRVLTQEVFESWDSPPFQRPVSVGKNVAKASLTMQDTGCIMTAIYLGVWEGKTYIVDGQHRRVAFIGSGLDRVVAPVITKYYKDDTPGLLEMCEDFLLIQAHIKNPTANDKLRALEPMSSGLQKIRKECPFVGYGGFRCNKNSPIVSMAQVIRSMVTSGQEELGSPAKSAVVHAREMTLHEANSLTIFLKLAFEAWGRDKEHKPLWTPMNMSLCLWFFRRMLKAPSPNKDSKGDVTQQQFSNIFFELLSNRRYRSLLQANSGGRLGDPEVRNPVLKELMRAIKRSLKRDKVRDYYMPDPSWAW